MMGAEREHVAAHLVKDAASGEWIPAGLLIPILIGVAGVLLILGILAWRAWRWHVRTSPDDRAFDLMGLRLRLWPREKDLVCRLAARIDASPVALLVSRGAFDRAAGAVGDDSAPHAAMRSLRRKVFEPRER